jgi:hypothetical protein
LEAFLMRRLRILEFLTALSVFVLGGIFWLAACLSVLASDSLLDLDAKISADFNQNGSVEDLDFSKWTSDYGVNDQSDANGDGYSGGDDFLAWQRQLGRSNPSPPNDTIGHNPEPAALAVWGLLAGCGGLYYTWRRRRA